MKRLDAFLLGMTAFVFATCTSYVLNSGWPLLSSWEMYWGANLSSEGIGFPFVMYYMSSRSIASVSHFSWFEGLINLTVAMVTSYLLARLLGNRLPPLWPGHSRTVRFSLRGLLLATTLFGVVLGLGMSASACGLVIRNLLCLAGPVVVYACLMYQRRMSWTQLTLASVGLALLTLAIDFRYQEPALHPPAFLNAILPGLAFQDSSSWWDWEYLGFPRILRALVPAFGLPAFLVLVSATYSIARQYYPLWVCRDDDFWSMIAEQPGT